MKNTHKRDIFFFILIAVLVSLYFLPYLNMYLYRDEGNWIYGAERFFKGEIVYRDFFEYIFPGIYFVLAFLYKLFGVSFAVARGLALAVNISVCFLVYLLAKRIKNSVCFILVCILFLVSMLLPWWNFLSHHMLSVTSSLLSTYLFCKYIESDYKRINLILCGLSSALVAFFTQSVGFYVVAGGNLFLVVNYILQAKYEALNTVGTIKLKQIITNIFIYNLVIGLFLIPVLAFFWAHSALGDMVYFTFTWILKEYKLDTALSYFAEERAIILAPLHNFSFGALVGSIKEIFIGYFQIIGFGLTFIYVAIKSFGQRAYIKSKSNYLLLYTLIGGGVYIASLTNPRDWQIRTMSVAGYVLALFYIFHFLRLDDFKLLRNPLAPAGRGQGEGDEGKLKPNFNLSGLLRFAFLAALIGFLSVDVVFDNISRSLSLYKNNSRLETTHGTISASESTINDIRQLKEVVEKYTKEDDGIFFFYHQSVLYFLLNRPNPTKFNTIDFYYTDSQIADVIDRLKTKKPKLVFRDDFIARRHKEVKFSTYFTKEEMLDNPVENYVKAHYNFLKKIGSMQVYILKEELNG